MKKRVLDISDALKAEILSESFEEGAVITAVSKRHNLSYGTVYGWRSEYRKLHQSYQVPDFVELLPELLPGAEEIPPAEEASNLPPQFCYNPGLI